MSDESRRNASDDGSDAPSRIGPYRILQPLGEGGMGEVYEAEQTEPVRRRVALKIIKLGMDTKQVVARFEAERQALAVMDHPNIARVFDGGSTEQGRPYFVMELVRGTPLNDYCDTQKLTTRERIELFMKVCEAIQHAHQKGVIHRDLKPSNVLIAVRDGMAVPKVIDFGIAKAVGQDLTDKTLVTRIGQMVGTPEYASPEQVEMSGVDVDTRTDIYSLGVMLYQLLIGTLPHDFDRVAGYAIGTVIREKEAQRPSQRLTTLPDDTQETVARYRHTDPAGLRKALEGDLDWVVMKCLEKDRTRRYETANALAMELGRVLADEPVVARPPSTGYRLRKFVRRNRVGVAAAAVATLAILGGATGAVVGMVRAQRAEATAAREAATAERVSDFLADLFEVSDPGRALGSEVTARELLDAGAQRIETELADQPIVQARLMTTIGDVYRGLGLYDQGRPLLERALELYDAEGESGGQAAGFTRNRLAYLSVHTAEYDRAEQLASEAMETFAESPGVGSQPWAEALNHLAFGRLRAREDPEELATLLEEALPAVRETLGENNEWTATTMDHLCWAYVRLGTEAAGEAERVCLETLALRKEIYDDLHPTIGYTLTRVAAVYSGQGRYEETLTYNEEALELAHRLYGDVHPEIAYPLVNIAEAHRNLGDPARGLPYAERALDIRRQVLEPDNPEIALALNAIAAIQGDLGNLGGAIDHYEQAVDLQRRAFGPENSVLITPLNNLAHFFRLEGDLLAADTLLRRALAIAEAETDADSPTRLTLLTNYARVLAGLGRVEQGLPLARTAYEGFRGALGEGHVRTAVALTVLGRHLTLAGDLTEAAAALTTGWEVLRQDQPVGSSYRRDALDYLASLYEAMGQPVEADRYRTLLEAEVAPDAG